MAFNVLGTPSPSSAKVLELFNLDNVIRAKLDRLCEKLNKKRIFDRMNKIYRIVIFRKNYISYY